ncbi:MAG: cupin domain-containing protein [Cryomorphaceae bacterium]|nr:cupin domain-containing protein [Flavobacteriales bacterium]
MKKIKLKSSVQNQNSSKELPKGADHIIVEIVEYIDNAVMSRIILKKVTGNVTAMSFSEGEELSEKTIPFDTYIQIIDGSADITIEKKTHHLKLGSGIVIPAHTLHRFNANQKFKMISTLIKSGYEDVS